MADLGEKIDLAQVIKDYKEIDAKKKAITDKKKIDPTYQYTEADQFEYQQLSEEEAKKVDKKANKFIEAYQADAKQSAEFIARFKQGITQAIQQPQAGALTLVAAALAGVCIELHKKFRHDPRYWIVDPTRPRSSSDSAIIAKSMGQFIDTGIIKPPGLRLH